MDATSPALNADKKRTYSRKALRLLGCFTNTGRARTSEAFPLAWNRPDDGGRSEIVEAIEERRHARLVDLYTLPLKSDAYSQAGVAVVENSALSISGRRLVPCEGAWQIAAASLQQASAGSKVLVVGRPRDERALY